MLLQECQAISLCYSTKITATAAAAGDCLSKELVCTLSNGIDCEHWVDLCSATNHATSLSTQICMRTVGDFGAALAVRRANVSALISLCAALSWKRFARFNVRENEVYGISIKGLRRIFIIFVLPAQAQASLSFPLPQNGEQKIIVITKTYKRFAIAFKLE